MPRPRALSMSVAPARLMPPAVAGTGAGEDAAIEAPAETAAVRASVPAAATMIAFERFVDMNEGRGICRAKTKPLIASAWRDQLPPLTACYAHWGKRGRRQHADLTRGQGARLLGAAMVSRARCSANQGFRFVLTVPWNSRSPQRHSGVTGGSNSLFGRQQARNTALIRDSYY